MFHHITRLQSAQPAILTGSLTSANRRFEGRCDHLYKTALIITLLPQSTSHVQQMMNGVDAIELAKKVYS